MPKFQKGTPKPKTSGRKKGTRNKATENIKTLLHSIYTEDVLRAEFNYFLTHKDDAYRWRSLELTAAYLFGKPVMTTQSADEAPLLSINVSAIPKVHERAD